MLVMFHLAGEHISDTSLGLDDLRCARVGLQLAAKAQNLNVDAAIEHVFVHSGRLQKMLAAKRPLRRIEEGDKQRVLAFGQRDVRAVRIRKPSGAQIEPPAGKPIAAAFRLACRPGAGTLQPPNNRAHPRQKLAQVEWLRHVVVGAELKTDHTVDFIPTVAGDNNHRHIRTRPKLAQHIEPIRESESKIQYYNIDFYAR